MKQGSTILGFSNTTALGIDGKFLQFRLRLWLACLVSVLPWAWGTAAGSGPKEVTVSAQRGGYARAPAGRVIWDAGRIPDRETTRLEFPDLIRFRDAWYCAFREGEIHDNHPSGRGRVIRSADGKDWHSVALMEWDEADVRDPRLSVTAEGQLMLNSSIYFPSAGQRGTPPNHSEAKGVTRQSVTWLSSDGENWTSVYACATGVNSWRWDATWQGGMGYSIAYGGKDGRGTLYRTRDGKSWRVLLANFFPGEQCSEAALAFAADGVACCLLRDGRNRGMIGLGTPPTYQQWQWQAPRVDWQGDGRLRPAAEVWKNALGGPKIICLSDGRFLGAARVDGRVTLFFVDPEEAVFTKFIEVDGTSYPGLVEHVGRLWITYATGTSAILLTEVSMPD